MSERLPIIYSAHHASADFGKYSERCALTTDQRLRFSDYGTAETVPTNGILTLRSIFSRGIIDLNRGPIDLTLFHSGDFAQPKKNSVWKEAMEPTDDERDTFYKEIYLSYHQEIINALQKFDRPGLVIAWDNTAHYVIGKDSRGKEVEMKPFILSNFGQEGSTKPDPKKGVPVSCDPDFLLEFGRIFQKSLKKGGLPAEIYFNLVYKGGEIAKRYSTRGNADFLMKHDVQSFQVEYDMSITHDQATLEPKPDAVKSLKEAFEEAIELALVSN